VNPLISCDRQAHWLRHARPDWPAIALKYRTKINQEVLTEDTDPGREIRYIDISAVSSNGVIGTPELLRFADAPSRARRVVRHGDTIVSTVRTYLRAVAQIPPDDADLVASTGFAVVSSLPGKYDSLYLSYWLRGSHFVDEVCARSVGVSYPATNASEVGAIPAPIPPMVVQKTIASFLDRKTAAIDALIGRKEKLLELLKEKRSALIDQAVTKGLDPTVPMKDSGIPWIGKVPAHWTVSRLKHFSPQITVGIVVTPAKYYTDSGVPCPRSLNIKPGLILREPMVFISPETNELHSKSKLRRGDLLCVRTGQPGTTAVVDESLDGANCIDLIVVRNSAAFVSSYLCFVMNSTLALRQYEEGAEGALQQHFNVETAGNLLIPLPPVSEQTDLARRLLVIDDNVCRMANRVRIQLALLREYRQSLITAAVTGQLDIPEAPTP